VGYTVCPVAADLDAVRNAIGSKDGWLLGELTAALAGELDDIDDMLVEYAEDNDGGAPVTAAEVLRHLIMGQPYRADIGFAYGYCFAALCAQLGESLSNDHWSAVRSSWFPAVQSALAQIGVGITQFAVDRLVYRGPPVKLPSIHDFPNIGFLTRAEVADARAALASADLSKVTDRAAAAAIEQMRGWFAACVKSHRDLVCTYA
jgi:hypothetical protein